MLALYYLILFLVSCFVLSWAGARLVRNLVSIAEYLQLREFIVGFFVMAIAACLPNFFVDFTAALKGIPQLAFGDAIGGNIVDFTLVMALAVFFSRKGISSGSRMVQGSSIFTSAMAILPLILILDGSLSRTDGIILILGFVVYSLWMFMKEERFKKVYSEAKIKNIRGSRMFLWILTKAIFFIAILLLASQQIVNCAQYFSSSLMISVSLVGLLIVGLGNCFPETYFSIVSARKNENWLILGDIMGAILVCATLDLGIVALINPFTILDLSPFYVAIVFTVISAIASFWIIRSEKKISKREGLILLGIYLLFLLSVIFIKFT